MTTEALLTKRNEELAKQDALIQDLLARNQKLQYELSEAYILTQKLQAEVLTLKLQNHDTKH